MAFDSPTKALCGASASTRQALILTAGNFLAAGNLHSAGPSTSGGESMKTVVATNTTERDRGSATRSFLTFTAARPIASAKPALRQM
jgi:hypothetical protein